MATSRQEGNPPIGQVHPWLAGRLDLRCVDATAEEVAETCECVFSCLPHNVATRQSPVILSRGRRMVDFSADYRLKDPQVYREWYGEEHADPTGLPQAVYGLPELYRDSIRTAQLVANPGCYPTSAILALAPLLKARLIEPTDIIIDSKSGVSGAGRTPKANLHFPECNENFSAYNVGKHRHTPEIEQVLGDALGQSVQVIFTPHLVPMDRGILTTAYSRPVRTTSESEVMEVLRRSYEKEPYVRVVDGLPSTKDSAGSNFCDVTARVVRGRILTISCLDNLVKGAAGAAVQNFNLMHGYPETMGLC
jgi:N-acetyl-gamma-glutamyl-phosphate reductase